MVGGSSRLLPEFYRPLAVVRGPTDEVSLEDHLGRTVANDFGHTGVAAMMANAPAAIDLLRNGVQRLAVLNRDQLGQSAMLFGKMAGELFARAGSPEPFKLEVIRTDTGFHLVDEASVRQARVEDPTMAQVLARTGESLDLLGQVGKAFLAFSDAPLRASVRAFIREGKRLLKGLDQSIEDSKAQKPEQPRTARDEMIACLQMAWQRAATHQPLTFEETNRVRRAYTKALQESGPSPSEHVVAAAREIAAMKSPSIEGILRRNGYPYEARKVAELVRAAEALSLSEAEKPSSARRRAVRV